MRYCLPLFRRAIIKNLQIVNAGEDIAVFIILLIAIFIVLIFQASVHGIPPDKNTKVGCNALGSSQPMSLLHWQVAQYECHLGSPRYTSYAIYYIILCYTTTILYFILYS